jgi:hypothetical protein
MTHRAAETDPRQTPQDGVLSFASARRARLEVAAVVGTGLLHLLFEEVLHQKALYIGLAAGGWLGYLGWRLRKNPGELRYRGFRRDGLRRAFVAPSIFGVLAALAIAGVGAARGTFTLHWHMLPLLALYPIWGWIQQFLVQALLARNLQLGVPALASPWRIAPLAAICFGIVHWPDWWLVAATCALGLVFTPIYLRERNLWPLGLWHGWLGVLAYFWLLARDPWVEMVG